MKRVEQSGRPRLGGPGLAFLLGAAFAAGGVDLQAGLVHLGRAAHPSAAALQVEDGFAFVTGLDAPFFVVDVRDPAAPRVVATLDGFHSADLDLLAVEGRRIAAVAEGGVGTLFHTVDVTEPTAPVWLATLDVGRIVHNAIAIPGSSLVYNARSGEPPGGIDILDLWDPVRPVVRSRWEPEGAPSCHDIHVATDPLRAYCAAGDHAVILDLADPLDPKPVARFANPVVEFHHTTMPTPDQTLLVLSDESFVACAPQDLTPNAGCLLPTGTIWFYGLADIANPRLLGYLVPPSGENQAGVVSAHQGDFVPGTRLLAWAWYTAGVALVDFTDPSRPRLADLWDDNSQVWDVRWADGFLFAGDVDQGLDVLAVR